jgi:DnaJ-domain-containing protein 1
VQPFACCSAKQANAFAVFNMAPSFDVDLNVLETAFKSLQRRVHPDSFYSKSKTEAEYALQVS